jgi:glyoxylase-like metal-dependent hydrolase (beta-lactamase superfamily II)
VQVGGVRIELVEAHGETHDQLFVWLPDKSVLLPGDNYYHSFPNLYSIRGTSPR